MSDVQIFTCGRRHGSTCHYCSRRAIVLCDHRAALESNTCSRRLCGQCAVAGTDGKNDTYACRFHLLKKT